MTAYTRFETTRRRTAVLSSVVVLCFALAGARLFQLQVLRGAEFRARAEDQHGVYRKLYPSRGEIKIQDRFSGQLLSVAVNSKRTLAYAVPGEVMNPNVAAEALASALSLDPTETLGRITDHGRKYVVLKKNLTEAEQSKVKELDLVGIYFDSEDARYYPEKNLLSHVLGFVGYRGDQKTGLYGLERSFEGELAGKAGYLSQDNDVSGAWIAGARREGQPPEDGVNLVLTVDKTIQFKAQTAIREAVEKHGADSGSVIVANPKTGAILAMAGYPDFDPNQYAKVEDIKVFTNEATVGSYEPGSIFKPLTMAAAIEEGKVTPETTYDDTGEVKVDQYTIKNSDGKAHGVQTMTQVLEQSLNTGAIFAKEQIGNQRFFDYVKQFGFGSPTGVELPEQRGNLDNLKANIKVNFHTASFGQGISVTPIQMVQAYTALANSGKMVKPYIVQAKVYPDGRVERTEPEVVREVLSARTAHTVSAMLVNVVENGHGKRAGVPGYYIAGKTGTAQVARKDGKGYEENNNIGSFIGYGPVEDPQFLMLVRVNHPRSVSFAESTAAPAFGEIAKFILSYLQVPPSVR